MNKILALATLLAITNFGCDSGNAPQDETMAPIVLADTSFITRKSLESIDFYATGNEPSWSLDIYGDKMIRLKTLADGDSILTPYVNPQRLGATIVYDIETESAKVKITIRSDSCRDTMSDEVFPYQATVQFNRTIEEPKTYTGCGRYVPDYRLTGKWELQTLNGNAIHQENGLRETPFVEIDPFEGSFSGNAGCNSISGTILNESAQLYFSNIVVTRMACPSPLEDALLNALGTTNNYSIGPESLSMSNGSEVLTKWKRVATTE